MNSDLFFRWFERFKERENYENTKKKIQSLSEMKETGKQIEGLGKFSIPLIQPDSKIFIFHKEKSKDYIDFSEKERAELEKTIQLFFGDGYREREECFFFSLLLSSLPENKNNICLKKIKDSLETDELIDIDILEEAITHEDPAMNLLGVSVLTSTMLS
jgi:hypothetical protein